LPEALRAAGKIEESSVLLATVKREASAMGLTRLSRLAQDPRDQRRRA
jgi:hypothetical protein